MASELPKSATEEVKLDLFEDDDEFEEFDVDQGRKFLELDLHLSLFNLTFYSCDFSVVLNLIELAKFFMIYVVCFLL